MRAEQPDVHTIQRQFWGVTCFGGVFITWHSFIFYYIQTASFALLYVAAGHLAQQSAKLGETFFLLNLENFRWVFFHVDWLTFRVWICLHVHSDKLVSFFPIEHIYLATVCFQV